MPRPKYRSQPSGHKGKKNYKHRKGKLSVEHGSKKHKQSLPGDNVGRKFKYIRRNQESEEAQRRQRKLEENFQERNKVVSQYAENDDSSSEEEQQDAMEQLMSTLAAGVQSVQPKTNKAIDSSDSDGSDDENDGHIDSNACNSDELEDGSDGDDIFPEKFEEQSQPRGRLYRSSDEESDQDEEEDGNSDDDLPEDTVLRPEESKERKSLDDSVEINSDEGEDEETGDDDDDDKSIEDNDDESDNNADIFSLHLSYELSPELLECVNTTRSSRKEWLNWPEMGRLQVELPTVAQDETQTQENGAKAKKKKLTLLDDNTKYASEGTLPTLHDVKTIDLERMHVKVQIQPYVAAANRKNVKEDGALFTQLQVELFSIMNNYQDLFYPQRSHSNGEEIRFIYTMHALNHILKTRAKVLNHNMKLKLMAAADSKAAAIVPDMYRDQGLFRTKVLIVAPFRDSALRIVNILISLLFPTLNGEQAAAKQVMHYKRFLDEFGGESLHFPKKNPKPEDYELTFAGNSDDTFRIGVTLTRKCIKLYSDFYSSDILIVSPLGLRMIIGAAGDKERDYDFLASIEMLILDQADVFLAQNWDHLLHIMDHLHLQPQSARNTDFSRVRSWCLNGWSQFYRQTLLFASHELPEFRSLFNSRCSNYRGKVRLTNPIVRGFIKHVAVQIPQVFHRIDVSSIQASFDQRFDHFINHILPQFKSASKAHCLIFIPSYFDFVRIRNYMKKETINFVQICEYTKEEKIDRARSMFFHSGAHFMLYSERAHFFRRIRLKGIRHLVMYQPPTWPHFYPELVNLMHDANQNPRDGGENSMSVTILYTKYDMLQMASIVGSEQAAKMAASDKSTHMFMTEE